jgi:CRP/FNR family transcriptional regulator
MTRAEIGNYLGLAMESVSRVLSHLQAREIIAVEGKDIVVQDVDKLRNAANGCFE